MRVVGTVQNIMVSRINIIPITTILIKCILESMLELMIREVAKTKVQSNQ